VESEIEITILGLTPSLLNDYLSFFDQDAFVDNPHWASCYCYFNFAPHQSEDWKTRSAEQNRAAVMDLIRDGRMQGYLAYAGGKPVGWCNANLHASYTTLDDDEPERDKIGAIVCFVVAKPYRGMGVARCLLEAACAGFQQQGVSYIEAYPRKDTGDEARNYHGPLSMYLSAGFTPVKETGPIVVVRKTLPR
jgi:GNAT superfamily N-acetyltransferase